VAESGRGPFTVVCKPWNEPGTYLTKSCKANHYILNNMHYFSCFTYLSRKLFRTDGSSEALQPISETDWKLGFLNCDGL